MGQLQNFVDVTGKMSPIDVNATNISSIIDEFNRSQDLLDALNVTPKIITKGTTSVVYNGGTGDYQTNVNIGTSVDFNFLVYYINSNFPDVLRPVPDWEVKTSDHSLNNQIISWSVGDLLYFDLFFYQAAAVATYTFYYFVIQQPSNVSI